MGDETKKMRLAEAAMALLQACPDQRMKIVLLNKALFYLDLEALLEYGDAVTGNAYMALKMGPVVAKYEKRLVANLEGLGWAQQDRDGDGMSKPVRVIQPRETWEFISSHEAELARAVAKRMAKLTSARASELSHRNPGWLQAWAVAQANNVPVAPIDMNIAMQELVDHDPWLDEAPDAELARAFNSDEADSDQPF